MSPGTFKCRIQNAECGMKSQRGPSAPLARHSTLCTPNSALKRAGFYNLRALQEVCPKHRKNHRETVGWYRKIARGVCSLLKWHGPGALNAKCKVHIAKCLPALNFRGCDLTAECFRRGGPCGRPPSADSRRIE